jgi:serine protease Do
MMIDPFYVGTCENNLKGEEPIVFEHLPERPFDPFPIQDPFGLRKAIVPVFNRDLNASIIGMGTAFHVDGWGTFLTANHVIDFAQENPISASSWTKILPNSNGDHPILFFGMGLVYGKVKIFEEAFVQVESMIFPMGEKDDPFTNGAKIENIADIAVLTANIQPEARQIPSPHFIPLRVSSASPAIGDTVLAVGFPELDCQKLDEDSQISLLTEGMYGAYGIVTAIHPCGRDSSTPTPVFKVKCNWPSGISGGPVFNSLGEVIGMVSRSYVPDDGSVGEGWAAHFGLISYFNELVPTLDIENPRVRRGWAVLRTTPWHVAGFFRTESEAQQLALSMYPSYQVEYGSSEFGTDLFISQNFTCIDSNQG